VIKWYNSYKEKFQVWILPT